MFSVLLIIYLGVELQGYKLLLVNCFEELADCFPKQLHRFAFPPATYEDLCLHIPRQHLDAVFLVIVILVVVKLQLVVVLICISLVTNDVGHLFTCLLNYLCIFFGEIPIQILCPFFNQVVFSLLSYLYVLDTNKFLIKCMICKCFLSYYVLFSHFLFFFFWLCWVFVAALRLSLVTESRGYSLLPCVGFSLRWLLLLRCAWASVVVAHGLSCSTACGIFPDQGSNPCPLHS